jgi:cytochrome c peroxidase
MHNGSMSTLEEVIEFDDGGGRPSAVLDSMVRPLRLTSQEKRQLAAFLRALPGDELNEHPRTVIVAPMTTGRRQTDSARDGTSRAPG